MSRRILSQIQRSNKKRVNKPLGLGIVMDVVLDGDSEAIKSLQNPAEGKADKNFSLIGAAKIRKLDDTSSSTDNLRYYRPEDYSFIDLPIIGEIVQLMTNETGGVVYKRIISPNLNTGNAKINVEATYLSTDEGDGGNAKDYSQTSQTGTTNKENSTSTDNETFGEYFTKNQVNHLKLFEGDKVIQTRFGQSIRFSGYNNEENSFAPSIIIRNRQGSKSLNDLKIGDFHEENFVDDGSTIALTSGEKLLAFTPGTVDTPLETEPIYAEEPELKGTDQALINSGRIILSAKDSEMLFYSKGNYSFISDGKLTIDNGLDGADMDFNGDVLITTNDNDFKILGGSGEIFLNTEETKEPLVRGQVLVDLMGELIDAINNQIFSTPAGPSAVGPNNKGDFNKIKNRLETFLSTLNYTE
tara:strand:+ start:3674 stop:4912 length:1239 start_codon:yes stop_codon:yes gene_type:complete